MILRAIEHSMPWERVQSLLEEILVAMSRFDCHRALHLLGEVVEEYKPAPESHDLVWARQAAMTVDDAANGTTVAVGGTLGFCSLTECKSTP